MTIDKSKMDVFGYLKRNPIVRYYIQWAAIYLGVLIVAVVIMMQISVAQTRVANEIGAIRSKMEAMAQLNLTPDKRDEVLKQIQKSAELELRQFVKGTDMPSVIAGISTAAGANQVQLKKVNSLPSEPIAGFPYMRAPIQIELEGEYSRIGDFISDLRGRLPALYTWDKIKISGNPKSEGGVLMEIKMTFYSKK